MPFCPHCGAQIAAGSNYCTRCGQQIEAATPVESPPVSVPPAPSPGSSPPHTGAPVSQYFHTTRKERNVWKIAFIISVVIFIPLSIFLLVLYSNTSNKLDDTRLALVESQAHVASLQAELADTQQTLDATQQDLAGTITDRDSYKKQLGDTQITLAETQTDLAKTQDSLETMTADRNSYKNQLASSQATVTSLQKNLETANNLLSAAQSELATATSTLSGLGITLYSSTNCTDVKLTDNPSAQNPTWKELKAFLSQDNTEDHEYLENVYDCSQFSRDLHNNAEAAGIRAAEVQVRFEGELTGHALNAFLTTDYGLVFIDCTRPPDTLAHVKKGVAYRAVEITYFNITKANITNESWWNNLLMYGISYYYIPTIFDEEAVTSVIRIYW